MTAPPPAVPLPTAADWDRVAASRARVQAVQARLAAVGTHDPDAYLRLRRACGAVPLIPTTKQYDRTAEDELAAALDAFEADLSATEGASDAAG